MQEHTSAKTSVNMVPTLFKRVPEFGKKNLDIGGGKFDTASEWLLENHGCRNLVYDPYNRTPAHNNKVIRQAKNLDSVTISNVLNVIKEAKRRKELLAMAAHYAGPETKVYITVYEGDRSGEGRETRCGYQLHRKTEAYMREVKLFFDKVERKGKLIIASDPV
jgi:hypothetical protein